jgi:hypothetical protein
MEDLDDDDVLTVPHPADSAVLVEYPGYICNPANAIKTLGGSQELDDAVREDRSLIKLQLRPQNQSCHPLYGERQDCQGLLLRISRRKGQPDADVKVRVVARIGSRYAFQGLADYQYLEADPAQHTRDLTQLPPEQQPEVAEPVMTRQPLLVTPPIFSKYDLPVAYGFPDQTGKGEFKISNSIFESS